MSIVDIDPPGLARLGSYDRPIELDGPIPETYPEEYKDRAYIWVRPKNGEVTKWYRSYDDYCD